VALADVGDMTPGGRIRRSALYRYHRSSAKSERMQVVIIAFSVTPLGVGEDVGELVADAVRVVRASGLPNHTDAMFTSIEGEWDDVMAVVKAAVEAVQQKTNRVSMVLKADIRAGVTNGLVSKVDELERYLSKD
jgi:uncharacterized protein (TIGR00106 family)